MAIDRQYGKIVFICDECADDLETDESDFSAALAIFHKEGWVSRPVDSDGRSGAPTFRHFCADDQ